MNRFYCVLPIACSLLLFSCEQKEKPIIIPDSVLSQEKMVHVLTDIHIAEAETNLRTLPDSTSKKPVNFQKIFETRAITQEQYDTSIAFYVDHPEILDKIYAEVLNELSKMQAGNQ